MNALRRFVRWPDGPLPGWLRGELLRRAATQFEAARRWAEAAACRAELNEHAAAAELYLRAGNLESAAAALLRAGDFAGALAHYRAWAAMPRLEPVSQVRALLGEAACHFLGAGGAGLTAAAGRAAYRRARELVQAELQPACWVALAEHGVRLGRYDLVQEGYDRALELLTQPSAERVRIARAYLAAARERDDRLLVRALEERLAGWGEFREEVTRGPV